MTAAQSVAGAGKADIAAATGAEDSVGVVAAVPVVADLVLSRTAFFSSSSVHTPLCAICVEGSEGGGV